MTGGDEGGSSALGALSRNWRSALVVNGLFDALEETERQRDELAHNLSRRDQGPPLFDAATENNNADGGDDAWLPPADRDSSSGGEWEPRKRQPPLLRHSLLGPSASPRSSSPPARPPNPSTASATRSGRREESNGSRRRVLTNRESDNRQHPTRRRPEARNGSDDGDGLLYDTAAGAEQMSPPPPTRTQGGGTPGFRDNREGNSGGGGGGGGHAASTSRARGGARSGGRGEEEGGRDGPGLSAGVSVGSVAGELRGGELERVRGRVADLGAAIETSQSKLLRELSQVQEDFFSSFGYATPLGASAATSAAINGGTTAPDLGGGIGVGSVDGFSSALSSIPPFASGGGGGGAGSHGYVRGNTFDRSRSPRWGGRRAGSGGGSGLVATSVSPRARPPLLRRDLDETAEEEEEYKAEARSNGSYHRGGTKISRGRTGGRDRQDGAAAAAAAATVDGASYAFPMEASSSSPREGGRTVGRGGERPVYSSSAGPAPRNRRSWKSLSPSPRTAADPAKGGWPVAAGAVGSARRSYIQNAGVDELRDRLLAELEAKEELAKELEDSRREAEEHQERGEQREGEVEELLEREADERRARGEAEAELEQLRVSHRALEEQLSALGEKAKGLEGRSTELERRSAQLEEKTAGQEREISRRAAELDKVSTELEQRSSELGEARAELGETGARLGETQVVLGETRGALGEKAAALERALSQLEEREARLGEARERVREAEGDRDRVDQELRDLQGVFDNFQATSAERAYDSSERTASAFMRERRRASLRAAIWQWRAITLKSDLGTAMMLADRLKLRQAKRGAFGAWLDLCRRRSHARALMSRLLHRKTAVDQRRTLRHWARQAAAAAAAAESAALARAEAEGARLNAAAVLTEALSRGQRRSLERGVGKLRDGVEASLMKSRALRRLSIACRHRDLGMLSEALWRWRSQASSREATATALRRLARLRRRRELSGAMRRWGGVVAAEQALEGLGGRVERVVRRARVARAVRVWREECTRQRTLATRKAGERCRRVLSGRLASAARRNLLMRCLMAWKAYAVSRRIQLRSARSFLLARNRRAVRGALVAWRDGRRRRAEAARKLWHLGRACRTAALREGLRRLGVSAREKERQEAAMIVSSAKLETEEMRRERDGMGSRLIEATEEIHRAARQRAKVEKELARRQRLAFGRECFAAWKAVAQAEQRKKACLVKLVRRKHDGFLHEALCSWRDETRDAAALEMVERVVTKNARRKLLQTTLRAWSEGARRRRRFAATFWRAARAVRSLEKRQQHGAFLAWRVAAVNETRRAADISGACARLRAVRKRPGRLQLASAFSIWARLSAASSHSDRHAEIAACAKRQRAIRTCFSTLRSNASLRRRARRALSSLDRRCSLRQLARGWGAMLRAAATASAERRSGLRLGRAEAAVAAGRLATRARAHRTARRLLGVARGRAALEAFVAWRGLVREGRGARLGAAALAGRSRRRRLHEVFGSWRGEALASSRLRSRALSRISQAAQGLVSEAFSTWREGSRKAHGKAKALTALARASDRRRSDRAEMRLALRTWRRNACGGDGDGGGGRGGDGEPRGGGMADGLEAVAGVFVEAAAAFSTASSIPEVFTLVEDFVSEVAVSSRGRLLLLNGEPGGGMFCLESDRRAPPDQDPLEASFPVGNGLVARCVATGFAFQTRRGGNGRTGGASPPRSSRRLYSTSGALDVALAGPADLHALPLQERYDPESLSRRGAENGAHAQPLSVSFQGWKKRAVTGPSPDSASTLLPPPASWDHRRSRSPDGSPVPGVGGSGRGPSRLAFFPASDDCGSSRSPSPAGRAGAGAGAARGYGFVSKSPPPGGGGRWWSESESPSPRRRRRQRQRSPSPVRAGGIGIGGREEEEEEEDAELLFVACLPVACGDGGQAMMGVLKAWREQQHQGDGGHRPPDKGFSGGEMAALAVVAGQAAAALRRVGAAASEREEVLQELDAAAADRVDETQKREEAVKEEMKHLREAMEHLSGSAKGLARQRDEARAALARAKGTLRRMVPALREARDRQLGFRHYHDLIVNMSKNVLQDGDGANPEADDERGRKGAVALTPCHAGCAGGGNGSDRCCRAASVGSHTRHNNNGSIGEDMGTRGNSPGARSTIAIFGSEGGGVSGILGRQGPRLAAGGGSAPLSECGFKVSPSSPRNKTATAVSFAQSGDDGGGDRFGPAILTVLRETAAAGGGSRVGVGAGAGAGTLMQDRGRSRERQHRTK